MLYPRIMTILQVAYPIHNCTCVCKIHPDIDFADFTLRKTDTQLFYMTPYFMTPYFTVDFNTSDYNYTARYY